MSPDIAASVRSRLLTESKAKGEEFELFLVRYACERFLYRLGRSSVRDRCVLKGAALLAIWLGDPYRATRDIDLLASGPADAASIRSLIEIVCAVPCPEDGMTFDLTALDVSPIRPDEEYQGQRALFWASLGSARIRMQVDFGFGDAVTPPAHDEDYPTLLEGVPSPRLKVYPQVASIAEKFEAMVRFGERNSRMKDFHDVWALATRFPFLGADLQAAVRVCFERRGTAWTDDTPAPLTVAFYAAPELAGRWSTYAGRGAFSAPIPTNFNEVGRLLRMFLVPVRDSIIARSAFDLDWAPGGPWA